MKNSISLINAVRETTCGQKEVNHGVAECTELPHATLPRSPRPASGRGVGGEGLSYALPVKLNQAIVKNLARVKV